MLRNKLRERADALKATDRRPKNESWQVYCTQMAGWAQMHGYCLKQNLVLNRHKLARVMREVQLEMPALLQRAVSSEAATVRALERSLKKGAGDRTK